MRIVDLRALPFYAPRFDGKRVRPWTLDDLEDFAKATDDPFAGRVRGGETIDVALQLEATSEPPVWTTLAPRELEAWAAGLSRIWQRFGLGAGDTIAFFDYGSNPAVLLSSSIYVSHLKAGAAERLGATSICNDGVASMTLRLHGILGVVRPAALVVRRDLVAPVVDLIATRGMPDGSRLRWAALTEVEGAPPPSDARRLSQALGVPVRRMLRADAAYFLAGECPECERFHVDPRLHRAEALADGDVAVTARFAKRCPAVRYRLGAGVLESGGCSLEPGAPRIAR